jgi:hypothetical protein
MNLRTRPCRRTTISANARVAGAGERNDEGIGRLLQVGGR